GCGKMSTHGRPPFWRRFCRSRHTPQADLLSSSLIRYPRSPGSGPCPGPCACQGPRMSVETPAEISVPSTDPVFAFHQGGKLDVVPSVPVENIADLSLAYTPGVARVCEAIAEHPSRVRDYTWPAHTVAAVTDGTAVLGLGDVGPAAALPVMECKALPLKRFAGVHAVPICLAF